MKNVDVRYLSKALIASLTLMVFWSCVTPTETPPEWIASGDAISERQLVAYGRGEVGDEAFQRAREDAVTQLSQILVRDLEAQGIAITDVVGAAVESRAARRLEVQEPLDDFQRRDERGAVEQYLLYQYQLEDRNRDLNEIYEAAGLSVSAAQEPEVVEPSPDEEETRSPLDVVRAMLADPIPASATERRRQLEEIRGLTEEVGIVVEPRLRTVSLGESLSSGFSVSVQGGDGGGPLGETPLRVEFRGPLVDGRRTASEIQVRTEEDGTAQIPVATPMLAGTTRIDVEPVWLGDLLSSWETTLENPDLLDLLSSIGEQLRARAAVQVTSQASSIPTAMIVMDRDIAGNPIGSGDTMRGMAQEFMNTDFRIRQVELSPAARRRLAEAESISVADLYDILPFEVLSRTERVIVGDAHIVEFSEEEGFTVVVEVEVAAFDLRRDRVLARVSFRERITGSDARSAIRTAFQAAGRRLVRQIVPRLP